MKKSTYAFALCGAVLSITMLSACKSAPTTSSGSVAVFDHYGVGGCFNQVAMNLTTGETCKLVDVPNVGFSRVYTCTAGGGNDLDMVSTNTLTGVSAPVSSMLNHALNQDAAHGNVQTTISCN